MSQRIWQKFLSPEQNLKSDEHSDSPPPSPILSLTTPTSVHLIDHPLPPPNSTQISQNVKFKSPNNKTKQPGKRQTPQQKQNETKKGKGKKIGSCFDLKISGKNQALNGGKGNNASGLIKSNQNPLVLLDGKQRSCELASKRKQSDKFFLPSSFKNTSNTKNWLGLSKYSHNGKAPLQNQENNEQEQQDSFSKLFLRQINKTEENKIKVRKGANDPEIYFYDMFITLKEIRDIEKENLVNNKRMLKIMEESKIEGVNKVVTNGIDTSNRVTHFKKGMSVKEHKEIKKSSIRRVSEKQKDKSTIKKGKGSIIEEQMQRVTDKLKEIERFKSDLEQFVRKAQQHSQHTLNSKTKKKSMSAFR